MIFTLYSATCVLRPPVIVARIYGTNSTFFLEIDLFYDQKHWNQRVVVKHRFHCNWIFSICGTLYLLTHTNLTFLLKCQMSSDP